MNSLEQPLWSVIVPVYNVEKYIQECLGSILNQSFRNFELILIDDASTDNCPAICDEYAARDERVTAVHHKKNSGLSEARNTGIRAASGKYLIFIDSDDYISDGSFENLAKTLETDGDSDVVILNIVKFITNGKRVQFDGFKKDMLYKKEHIEVLKYITSLSDFSAAAPLKLVNRQLIISNNIFFTPGIWGEDSDWSIKLYVNAKSYNFCEGYVYNYRKSRVDSLTYSFSEKIYNDWMWIISKWSDEIKKPEYSCFVHEIHSYLAFMYCMSISMYGKIDSKARKRQKEMSKKYSWLLTKSKDNRVALVKWSYRIFGLNFTSKLYCIYERVKKI